MSFIDDMKIGRKLVAGFLIVLLLLAIVAVIGYISLQGLAGNTASMYNDRVQPIDQIGGVAADMQQMRAEIYRYIYVPDSRADLEATTIPNLRADIKQNMDAYRATFLLPDEKTNLAKFDTAYAEWNKQYDLTIAAVKSGDKTTYEAQLKAGSPLINARTDVVNAYKALLKINVDEADRLNKENAAMASSNSMLMIVATILAVIIGVGIALYISKSITGPIEQVANNLKELKKGHLSVRLNLNRKDEIGDMAKTMDTYAAGQQKWVLGTMQKIAEGDLSSQLKAADAQDEVVPALQTTIDSIRDLVTEANTLSKAAVDGKLATRGNADKFKGGYREIVAGVNQTLDSVVGPVNEAMRVSNEYAQGNFTARVDEKLNVQGDFVKFKQALNNIGIQVSKSLTAINQQVGDLAASAEEANASVEEVSAGSAQVAKNASGVSVNAEKATQGVSSRCRRPWKISPAPSRMLQPNPSSWQRSCRTRPITAGKVWSSPRRPNMACRASPSPPMM